MNDDKKMNYFKYKLLCFHHTEKEDAVHGNYENIWTQNENSLKFDLLS